MTSESATAREPEWRFECADPRHPDAPWGNPTRIVIRLSAVRHILEKHVRPTNEEPWDELLGVEGRRRHRLDPQADPTDLVKALGEQIQRSLAKPQAMLAWQRLPSVDRGLHWHLILPCGALAVLGCGSSKPGPDQSAWLKTCYFVKDACEEDHPALRWGAAALNRLRYCVALASAETSPRMAPVQAGPVRVGDRELCQIRFVTPKTCWFDAQQRLRPRSRTTWEGEEPPPAPRRKLAPRR